MERATANPTCEADDKPQVLHRIHEERINITIYDRSLDALASEIDQIKHGDFELKATGSFDSIVEVITHSVELREYPLLLKDIKQLLSLFKHISEAKEFRLFFATVNNSMCRKFHTDINDIRMLCTYVGPGTQWLVDDYEDQEESDNSLVDDESIRQANEGSVVLLKGALYPKEGTKPVLHRSPPIEDGVEKRILLRVDTDKFANLFQ